jgi:hypothetical protein
VQHVIGCLVARGEGDHAASVKNVAACAACHQVW